MSPKVTSKNLSYDSSLPPFLQRLRAQNTDTPTVAPRPRRAPNPNDDEEDEPTYVDEEGTTLNAAELRSLGVKKGDPEEGEQAALEAKTEEPQPEAKPDASAAIGAARKRKVGKIVGAQEDEEEEGKGKKDTLATAALEKDKQVPAQKKKKVKKVKLSFGDDE